MKSSREVDDSARGRCHRLTMHEDWLRGMPASGDMNARPAAMTAGKGGAQPHRRITVSHANTQQAGGGEMAECRALEAQSRRCCGSRAAGRRRRGAVDARVKRAPCPPGKTLADRPRGEPGRDGLTG